MSSSLPPRARKTKIVATLGPATSTPEKIEALFKAGVDVFRLNFSHGTHTDHRARAVAIRDLEARYGRPVAILADLQGPKLRVGKFAGDAIDLTAGQSLRLDLDPALGNEKRVTLPHPEIITALSVGDDVLADDGRVRLRVTAKGADFLDTVVVAGKRLSNHKGVNVPGVVLPIPALTDKDRTDLIVALDMGVDWVALSFVQRPEDVLEARALIGTRAAICVKVEKPSALTCLDQLINLADGIMLARGDLGVETPAEDVPSTQKHVVRMTRAAGKPLIIATQMLESMTDAPTPTRAEASDVANAVYDGADAVMLSAETASGSYPLESVQMMDRIAVRVEGDDHYHALVDGFERRGPRHDLAIHEAMTRAAYQVARDVGAKAVVCYSHSGATAQRMAQHRPWVPMLVLTPFEPVARRLVLSYATHPVVVPNIDSFKDAVTLVAQVAVTQGLARAGDRLVMTAGVPFGQAGTTNIVRVVEVT